MFVILISICRLNANQIVLVLYKRNALQYPDNQEFMAEPAMQKLNWQAYFWQEETSGAVVEELSSHKDSYSALPTLYSSDRDKGIIAMGIHISRERE